LSLGNKNEKIVEQTINMFDKHNITNENSLFNFEKQYLQKINTQKESSLYDVNTTNIDKNETRMGNGNKDCNNENGNMDDEKKEILNILSLMKEEERKDLLKKYLTFVANNKQKVDLHLSKKRLNWMKMKTKIKMK
jgi:hypothetical protein